MSASKREPLTPQEAALARAMSSRRLSRRSMLGGAGALGIGAALAACGTKAPGTSAAAGGGSSSGVTAASKPTAALDRSDTDKVVNWANWTEYLDFNETTKTYPTLDAFQKLTGIKATYAEDVNDNETYYAKVAPQLKRGKDIGRDIFVLTDWMAARMVRQGYVQKLDHAQIPNLKNMRADLKNVSYDPGRNFSMTWQSGYTGIGYNVAEVKKLGITIGSVADLWKPELKNRVMVLSEMRDTVGLMMLQNGVDVTKFTKDQFETALSDLEKQLNNGQIREVTGNDYVSKMESGDAIVVMCWSGDVAQVNAEYKSKNPKLKDDVFKFILPEAGGMLWSDNLMIPIGSPHKKNAEILFNYYYDPKVAAKVADWVNYVCPVDGAEAELEKLDPALVSGDNRWLIFPDDATLKKVHQIRTLETAEETEFNLAFQRLMGL